MALVNEADEHVTPDVEGADGIGRIHALRPNARQDWFSGRRIENKYRVLGVSSLLLFVASVGLSLGLIVRGDTWAALALLPMVVVYHGTHEAVHGTIVPRWLFGPKTRGVLTYLLATTGFALVGHNYLYLRWSHQKHHTYGRLSADHTIDGKSKAESRFRNLQYYSSLVGFNCHLHELSGYIYALFPTDLNIVDRRFQPCTFPFKLYWITQLAVLLTTCTLLYFGGVYFLCLKVVFAVYWGMMQNVAHYGLEHGSIYAARTYRLNALIEFLLFKAGFRHVEHHAFPTCPGYCLDDKELQAQLKIRLGFQPRQNHGLVNYWADVLQQLRGPDGGRVKPKEWRSSTVD